MTAILPRCSSKGQSTLGEMVQNRCVARDSTQQQQYSQDSLSTMRHHLLVQGRRKKTKESTFPELSHRKHSDRTSESKQQERNPTASSLPSPSLSPSPLSINHQPPSKPPTQPPQADQRKVQPQTSPQAPAASAHTCAQARAKYPRGGAGQGRGPGRRSGCRRRCCRNTRRCPSRPARTFAGRGRLRSRGG